MFRATAALSSNCLWFLDKSLDARHHSSFLHARSVISTPQPLCRLQWMRERYDDCAHAFAVSCECSGNVQTVLRVCDTRCRTFFTPKTHYSCAFMLAQQRERLVDGRMTALGRTMPSPESCRFGSIATGCSGLPNSGIALTHYLRSLGVLVDLSRRRAMPARSLNLRQTLTANIVADM